MPSATIDTIITQLATVTVDGTATNSFQDDVIYELARGAYQGVLAQVDASFVAGVNEQERYTLPTNARIPLAIFYDNEQLLQLRKDEAWAYDQAWRDAPNQTVVGYVFDPEDRPNFSLVPPPKKDGSAIGGNTPTTVTSWPEMNITVISAKTDLTFPGTTYADLRLPVALEVLAREFARDSDHQDSNLATIAHNLADFFFRMFEPMGKPT